MARPKVVDGHKTFHTGLATLVARNLTPMLDLVLCSCGSGLRQIRCCNFEIAAAPEPASLEILNAMVVEATKLFNEKKPPTPKPWF